jgi:hypothetical protein
MAAVLSGFVPNSRTHRHRTLAGTLSSLAIWDVLSLLCSASRTASALNSFVYCFFFTWFPCFYYTALSKYPFWGFLSTPGWSLAQDPFSTTTGAQDGSAAWHTSVTPRNQAFMGLP